MIIQKSGLLEWGVFKRWTDDPRLVHGFSTRNGGVSNGKMASLNLGRTAPDSPDNVLENRRRFLRALGIADDRLVRAVQIHGDRVAAVHEPGVVENCDGLITREPELFLVIGVADCHVVFLASRDREVVGALHAGWRGISAGIVEQGIRKITEVFSVPPDEIEIAISPGIGVCCYEVGEDVSSQFSREGVEQRDGRVFLNLRKSICRRARAAGIPEDRIMLSDQCTSCAEEHWYSYRRDNGDTGRMWGIIGRKIRETG